LSRKITGAAVSRQDEEEVPDDEIEKRPRQAE
jgi:hypothetical protein